MMATYRLQCVGKEKGSKDNDLTDAEGCFTTKDTKSTKGETYCAYVDFNKPASSCWSCPILRLIEFYSSCPSCSSW